MSALPLPVSRFSNLPRSITITLRPLPSRSILYHLHLSAAITLRPPPASRSASCHHARSIAITLRPPPSITVAHDVTIRPLYFRPRNTHLPTSSSDLSFFALATPVSYVITRPLTYRPRDTRFPMYLRPSPSSSTDTTSTRSTATPIFRLLRHTATQPPCHSATQSLRHSATPPLSHSASSLHRPPLYRSSPLFRSPSNVSMILLSHLHHLPAYEKPMKRLSESRLRSVPLLSSSLRFSPSLVSALPSCSDSLQFLPSLVSALPSCSDSLRFFPLLSVFGLSTLQSEHRSSGSFRLWSQHSSNPNTDLTIFRLYPKNFQSEHFCNA